MTVRRILQNKGRDVVTMSPSATVSEAARVLAEKRIGALVMVDAENAVIGILSERDIVRTVAAKGASCLDERIADVMTLKVLTCDEDTAIDQVMEMMTLNRFRHIPVCDGPRLVGIVSIGDVVKVKIDEAVREAEDIRSYIATA